MDPRRKELAALATSAGSAVLWIYLLWYVISHHS